MPFFIRRKALLSAGLCLGALAALGAGCATLNLKWSELWSVKKTVQTPSAQPQVAGATSVAPLPDKRLLEVSLVAGANAGEARANAQFRLWVPVPLTRPGQEISGLKYQTESIPFIGCDKKYNNALLYVEGKSDSKEPAPTVRMEFKVRINRLEPYDAQEKDKDVFAASANANLPAGAQEAVEKASPLKDSHEKARSVAEIFSKTDGTSFAISRLFAHTMRRLGVTARVLCGVRIATIEKPAPEAWAWAEYLDETGKWNPVDAAAMRTTPTAADTYFRKLPADRFCLTVGQEILLEPPQNGGIIEFMGNPYAETNGKPSGAVYEITCRDKNED